MKDSAVHAAQETGDFFKDTHEKTQSVKEDIKNGFNEASRDMQKATKNISKDLKRTGK